MYTIIVGGGKIGRFLASILLSGGHQVKVIETNLEIVQKLEVEFKPGCCLYGSGTDPNVLGVGGHPPG